MEKEHYVLYGIDAGDDYLKLLSSEEFKAVKEALEKFTNTECVLCDLPDLTRVKHFKNNIIYLAKELIKKKELEIAGRHIISLDEDIEGASEEQAEEVIKNIVKNAEFIKKLSIEFKYKFQVLDTEVYLFRFIVAE